MVDTTDSKSVAHCVHGGSSPPAGTTCLLQCIWQKLFAFFTQKGGVGKTTTAHNVAVALTKKGKNVILIDADAQINLTASVLGLSDSVEYAESNQSKWAEAREKYTNIKKYLEW